MNNKLVANRSFKCDWYIIRSGVILFATSVYAGNHQRDG